MTTAQEASPVTDMTVRPMSMMRSMPAATATPSTGMPAEENTMAMSANEPPGMPGVPTDATVAANAMAFVLDASGCLGRERECNGALCCVAQTFPN